MMISRLSCAAAAAWLLLASTAKAQDEAVAGRIDRDVTFEGEARLACLMATPTAVRQVNATLQQADGGRVNVQLTPQGFIDPQTGVPRAAEIALNLPVTCNGPHHIRIASTRGSLLRDGAQATQSDFRSRLDFRVNLEFAGETRSFDTASAASADLELGQAATGNALVTISIPGGGAPLVAGSYSDTLVIEITTSP